MDIFGHLALLNGFRSLKAQCGCPSRWWIVAELSQVKASGGRSHDSPVSMKLIERNEDLDSSEKAESKRENVT
ncbi:hypothetical protein PM082_007511 [Marasmius tenuissimus]|nr:hypothetical protein PM082_007511 [Marasmius tenuissimus]